MSAWRSLLQASCMPLACLLPHAAPQPDLPCFLWRKVVIQISLGYTCVPLVAEDIISWRRLADKPVLLAKPITFMNNSGEAVGKLMRYYKAGGPRGSHAHELRRLLSSTALFAVSLALHAHQAAEAIKLPRYHKTGRPKADKASARQSALMAPAVACVPIRQPQQHCCACALRTARACCVQSTCLPADRKVLCISRWPWIKQRL